MFEDLARNLVVPHQLGMTTVLVVPDGTKEVVREDWELEGRDAAHVDHVTDDLTGFLEKAGRDAVIRRPGERRDPYSAAARLGDCVKRLLLPTRTRGYGSPRARGRRRRES